MAPRVALQAVRVNHRYEQDLLWRQPLSFSWEAPCAVTITGPNGAGKSTLLALIGGLLRPTEGQIHFTLNTEFVPSSLWRRHISWLSPHLSPPEELTIDDLLWSYGRFKKLSLPTEFLNEIQLKDRLHTPLFRLSSGQRQRLLLALTLAMNSPILILDEPTAFLDEYWKAFFHERIRALILQNKTFLVCATNDPAEAALFPENLYLGSYVT